MEHADTEIPQEKPAVIADTSKSVGSLVATPRVECDSRYPRIVTLASCNNLTLWHRPDCYQVVLAASYNVFAVG